MNIYVGNLAANVTEDDLRETFGAFGEVVSASVIKDKFSGESRGFGFVEMPSKQAAQAAMDGIKEIKGRMVTINEARPKTEHRGPPRRDSHGSRDRGGFSHRRY